MSTQATGTFTIDTWEATTYDERGGLPLAQTHVTKTFSGEIEGTSAAELLMAGTTAYVGLERIECRIHNRAGSFILQHTATQVDGKPSASWAVVPGSGAGELRGLRGEARIVVAPDGGHTCILDYELVDENEKEHQQ